VPGRVRYDNLKAAVTKVGRGTELPLFLMRLSASGRGFVRAYLSDAQEVFLDGHVRASIPPTYTWIDPKSTSASAPSG
jgi:hypothetical protein